MRALDIITKKRNGESLSPEEISFLIHGYVNGKIPEYQISAWLMAVFFQGMNPAEIGCLTRAMIDSGSVFDLDGITGPLVDKHSTGGVGDKTSLIIAPVVAALGLKVPMMSGRSLGHTGGTLDKLDSIPGFRTGLNQTEFRHILNTCGFAMTGQTVEVAPADRLLYALRDVTATVESIPLITASILSKKIAEGSQALVFDVKTGSGSFMKTRERSRQLARSLVDTAASMSRKAIAFITDMDFPLGYATGNFLEVEESYRCLDPSGGLWSANLEGEHLVVNGISADLMEVTLELSAGMLLIAGVEQSRNAALLSCLRVLSDGSAFTRFAENVELQGGDIKKLIALIGRGRATMTQDVTADDSGYFTAFDAFKAGQANVFLGAGRNTANDPVFPDVGFVMRSKRNERVEKGQTLLTIYARSAEALERSWSIAQSAVTVSSAPRKAEPMVREVIQQT